MKKTVTSFFASLMLLTGSYAFAGTDILTIGNQVYEVNKSFLDQSQKSDKEFVPHWYVQDNSIYLVDVETPSDVMCDSSCKKDIINEIQKGNKTTTASQTGAPILGSWINGEYYIQEKKQFSLSTGKYNEPPVTKLTIKDGKIISLEMAPGMKINSSK